MAFLTTKYFLSALMYLTVLLPQNFKLQENYIADNIPVQEKTMDGEISRLAKKYKQDENLARKIIDCESKAYSRAENKNYDENGVWWSTDYGPWQINNYYHEDTANKMDLDIHDQWDNLEYGFYLMSEEGTDPWNASAYCWQK